MTYVIACGDEGVQLNEGTRIGLVGAGFRLEDFSAVVKALKKVVGKSLAIAASEENDWIKAQLDLVNWEQVNASAQQHIQALADRESVAYAGFLPFSDPKQLTEGVKGHMVRPHGIHIANKVCFTLAGGEQTFNLGQFVISADWVSAVPEDVARRVLQTQLDFYTKLNRGERLEVVLEEEGVLDAKTVAANKAVLKKLGFGG